ncbi:Hypothetical protein FKW44_006141 [Caligus rogercresseyi]|uniref:Uncharacterized protein n=2 Tax=Caligus rogercresseyi TaxID=217165 RepID=A0A7T8KCY3_CALRO|nr:Hypothetical protein FKW44_006141 [Caligus rogercresseyi]
MVRDAPMSDPTEPGPTTSQIGQDQTSLKKREEEKICPSMWGKKPCPHNCIRVHLPLCSKAVCYGNTDARKECSMWHGHIRAAARVERKREREEEQKRQFKAWLKQGNSSTGKRGAPRNIQPPKQNKKVPRTLEKWENLRLQSEIALLRSKQKQRPTKMTTPSVTYADIAAPAPRYPVLQPPVPVDQNVAVLLGKIARQMADLAASFQD